MESLRRRLGQRLPTRGGQAGSARPAPGSRRPGCLVPLSPSVAQDGDPRVVARRTAFLVFQRELDRSGGGRPGPRRLRGTVWAGAARPGQAPGAQGLQGSGDVARQPRFQACGRDEEGTPGAWSREGLVAARLHAKAAGQGQVGRKVLVSWAPGPVVGGSFPFVRKVAAPVRQKRAPARAHLWRTPRPRLRAVVRPSSLRGRARVRGPRCCSRCSSPQATVLAASLTISFSAER